MIKKNIIYTGAFRFPEGDAAAARVLSNAKILKALGYKVTFVSWGGKPLDSDKGEDGNYYYEGFRYFNTNDIDIKQTNILGRIYDHFDSGKTSLRLIRQMIHYSDIIIGYNPPMFFTNKILKLCKSHNIPFVSDITEWSDSNEFPGGSFAPPSWINELNMSFTQKKVKNKIVISTYLNGYYKSSNNIILPPLSDKDEEKWKMKSHVMPESIAKFKGIRLIYAGTPAKKDNLFIVLKAVIKLVKEDIPLQFIVLGVNKTDIRHLDIYEDIIKMSKNIILLGVLPQNMVPYYYSLSDFSIIIRMPIKKNMAGFPTKFIESFIAGVPVISTNTSDIGKYLKTDKNGILLNGNSLEEILIGLRKLFRYSKEEIRRIKIDTRVDGYANFHYTEFISKFQTFINNLK